MSPTEPSSLSAFSSSGLGSRASEKSFFNYVEMALLKPVGGIGKKMTLDGKFGHAIASERS
ncbi:hypothetical protein Fmac_028422 [Flemingia macrophylla]|uniref:Uncharacterized protein n=1 Tax=Flemingia macrophylla TaxID=520843 RepID=A0ABD1L7G5_9FABA